MSSVVISGNTSGTVTLDAPDVAGSTVLTLPATSGSLFTQGNIVGTASQSGGVPTGAIIEQGSNANGEFVKFADGTMICTNSITESRTTTGVRQTNWTMPATFLSVTDYVPAAHPATSRPDIVVGTTPLRSSSSLVEIYVNRTNTTNTTVYVQSVGRWF